MWRYFIKELILTLSIVSGRLTYDLIDFLSLIAVEQLIKILIHSLLFTLESSHSSLTIFNCFVWVHQVWDILLIIISHNLSMNFLLQLILKLDIRTHKRVDIWVEKTPQQSVLSWIHLDFVQIVDYQLDLLSKVMSELVLLGILFILLKVKVNTLL